jgi:hypothetical protein
MTQVRQPYPIDNLSLAAGASSNIYTAPGQRITVIDCDQATLEVSIDGGPWVTIGLGLNVTTDAEFKTVKFRNPNGSTVNVDLVIGWIEYQDTRFHLAPGSAMEVSGTIQVGGISLPTVITPDAVNSLASGGTIDIAADATRKVLNVYNDNAANTVWLRNQAAATSIGIPIGPKQNLALEFAGACRITNNSGATCDIYVTKLTV